MPLFFFKLVDSTFVSAIGVHDLPSAAVARTEAVEIARSLRETRPELIGNHYSVSVTDENGGGVCVVGLDENSSD
jgi:hypothetical protein